MLFIMPHFVLPSNYSNKTACSTHNLCTYISTELQIQWHEIYNSMSLSFIALPNAIRVQAGFKICTTNNHGLLNSFPQKLIQWRERTVQVSKPFILVVANYIGMRYPIISIVNLRPFFTYFIRKWLPFQ